MFSMLHGIAAVLFGPRTSWVCGAYFQASQDVFTLEPVQGTGFFLGGRNYQIPKPSTCEDHLWPLIPKALDPKPNPEHKSRC